MQMRCRAEKLTNSHCVCPEQAAGCSALTTSVNGNETLVMHDCQSPSHAGMAHSVKNSRWTQGKGGRQMSSGSPARHASLFQHPNARRLLDPYLLPIIGLAEGLLALN